WASRRHLRGASSSSSPFTPSRDGPVAREPHHLNRQICRPPRPLRVRNAVSSRCPLYPQKRTLVECARMSALCQKRTKCIATKLRSYSITSSVSAMSEEGTGMAKCVCCPTVDDELKLGWQHNREFAGICAFQDFVHISGSTLPEGRYTRAIGHQATDLNGFSEAVTVW